MGLTNENLPFIHNCFKFNDQVLNIIQTSKINKLENKPKQMKKIRKILANITKNLKPPIPHDIIRLFYENPKDFFASYEGSIENTSFYDDGGNSIFIHYFYVLYDLYKKNSGQISDNIYEKNFNSFFIKEAKYLSMQDFSFETPLHKLAKFRNKKFFLYICKKLKEINILNEELILINNINRKSCLDYVLQDISENKNKIIKNNFEQYQEFLNYFPDLINSLPLEKQKLIITFSCLISFEEQNWNEINFNDTINSIYNLKKKNNDNLNIFHFLYYPNDSGLNYINYLFHICKKDQDFEKLFQLVLDITNINANDKFFKKLCLSDHIAYVLRKMNSRKIKGDMEINYGMKLIKQIIPLLIKDESEEKILNIISVRKKVYREKLMNLNHKGICNNLINNSSLSFEQKCDILSKIKEKLGKYFEDVLEKDFLFLYQLFDAYNKKEINEVNIFIKFKENIFVQKIFVDFYYIGDLYREIYKTWKEFPQMSINEYISSLNEFVNNNYLDIFGKYKTRYNLSNDKILIITKLIIAYEKQNYANEIEKEIILKNFKHKCFKHNDNFVTLYKNFFESKPKLTNILLSMLNKNKYITIIDFTRAFFSFKYDYEIIFNDENIINYFKFDYFCVIFPHKESFKSFKKHQFRIRNKFTQIFKASLKSAENQPYEYSFYKFILKNWNIKLLFSKEISTFNILMKRYLKKLIYEWNEECGFSELISFINENIFIFCFLFYNKDDNPENATNKINFFFDEFINTIEPKLKDKFKLYKKLALENINSNDKIEDFFNLEPKCYLSLWLIFIRITFGKYNPQVLISFFKYYGAIYPIFLSFLKAYFTTNLKQNILYHFLFSDCNLIPEEESKIWKKNISYFFVYNKPSHFNFYKYIYLFLSEYIYKLCKVENSLVFFYITKTLNVLLEQQKSKKKKDDEDENESNKEEKKDKQIIEINLRLFGIKPELYKYFILGINKNQDENIYNLIKEFFFHDEYYSITLFSFLEVEPGEFDQDKIIHYINILKQISIDLKEKTKSFKDEEIKKYIYNEISNDKTLLNLYRLLFVFKK